MTATARSKILSNLLAKYKHSDRLHLNIVIVQKNNNLTRVENEKIENTEYFLRFILHFITMYVHYFSFLIYFDGSIKNSFRTVDK